MATTSCSSFVSTASTDTNFVRLAIVNQKELPNILRELLYIKEPPHLLESHINCNNYLIKILRAHEWITIKTVRTNQYNEFDVPLMYKIIRNLNVVPNPTQGWDSITPPTEAEITLGDDVERIRRIRNAIVHRGNTNVQDTELANYFSIFKDIAVRFERDLNKTNGEFVSKIQNLEACCIDKDTEHQYLRRLTELAKNETEIASTVEAVQKDLASLRLYIPGIISKLRIIMHKLDRDQEEVIPKNIQAQIEKQIEKWRQNDIKFVPTKASKYVLRYLKDNNCVTVVGGPGVGKTAVTRHVALHLNEMGYAVIPITDPKDIRDFYKPGKRSVFVIDHIGGTFTAKQQVIDSWEQLLGVVEQISSDHNCKIVSSCRSQVYLDKKFNVLLPFKSCECNINSNSLRLSLSEKKDIAKSYLGKYDHDIDTMYHYDCFPLLCVIFSKQGNTQIEEFFRLPFEVWEKELNILWDQGEVGKCQIFALALCVINDNELQEKYLTSKETSIRHEIDDVSEACGLNRGRSMVTIKEDIDTLIGTYLTKTHGIYTTIHNKVFDFLVNYCSTKILDCLIDHAKLSFIRDRFLWGNKACEPDSDKYGFVTLMSDDKLTLYLNRLVFEWSHGRIEDVLLDNSNMANEEFRDRLLSNLRQRDKVEQSTLARKTAPCAELQFSCLEICCLKGYSNLLPWIFDQGVDMNQCISSITPLTFACLQNRTNIIKELLDLGANVNKSGISGMTPLHAACYYENIDLAVLELLLKQKANADKRMFDGSTPLLVASYRLNREAVNILFNSSANLNIGFYDTQTIKDGIKKIFKSITDEEEAKFWNLVIDFFQFLCVSQVKQIVNLIMHTIGKATPLHFACSGIDTNIIKDLLDRNPDINIRKEDGSTPLFVACELGNVDVVRLLLEYNADQNISKNDGTSPLEIAKRNKFAKIVTLLEGTNTKSIRTSNGMKRKK